MCSCVSVCEFCLKTGKFVSDQERMAISLVIIGWPFRYWPSPYSSQPKFVFLMEKKSTRDTRPDPRVSVSTRASVMRTTSHSLASKAKDKATVTRLVYVAKQVHFVMKGCWQFERTVTTPWLCPSAFFVFFYFPFSTWICVAMVRFGINVGQSNCYNVVALCHEWWRLAR